METRARCLNGYKRKRGCPSGATNTLFHKGSGEWKGGSSILRPCLTVCSLPSMVLRMHKVEGFLNSAWDWASWLLIVLVKLPYEGFTVSVVICNLWQRSLIEAF